MPLEQHVQAGGIEAYFVDLTHDSLVDKLVVTLAGTLVLVVLVKVECRALTPRVENVDTRYRKCRLMTFAAYLLAIFMLVVVVDYRHGEPTVVFGVAGVGIAFTFQEVISSAREA